MNGVLYYVTVDDEGRKSFIQLIEGDNLFIDPNGNKYILADIVNKPKSKRNNHSRIIVEFGINYVPGDHSFWLHTRSVVYFPFENKARTVVFFETLKCV